MDDPPAYLWAITIAGITDLVVALTLGALTGFQQPPSRPNRARSGRQHGIRLTASNATRKALT